MQDTLKLIGTRSLKLCVIVLAVLIGFGLAACGDSGSGSPSVPNNGSDPSDGGSSGGGGGSSFYPGSKNPGSGTGTTAKTLTLTGLPAEFNGKYAYFEARDNSGNVVVQGHAAPPVSSSVRSRAVTFQLPQISGGKVTIPLWNMSGAEYTGNGKFTTPPTQSEKPKEKDRAVLKIFEDPSPPDISAPGLITDFFEAIDFSGGVVEKAWTDLEYNNDNPLAAAAPDTYEDNSPWAPNDTPLSLEYSVKQEGLEDGYVDAEGRDPMIYPTTHYLLTGDFADVKAKLVDSFGEPKETYSGDDVAMASVRIGSCLFFLDTGLILEVQDNTSGGWGKEYRLVQKVNGKVKNVDIWQAVELWEDSGATPTPVLGGSGKVPELELDYTSSDKLEYPSGLIETYYYLTSNDYTAAQGKLQGVLGTGMEDPNTIAAEDPAVCLNILDGSAKTGMHPYWTIILYATDQEEDDYAEVLPYNFIFKTQYALLEKEATSSFEKGTNKRAWWTVDWPEN